MSDEQQSCQAEETSFTIEEIQEALEDESHPQHEEVVRRNRVLAGSVASALEASRKSVAAQVDLSSVLKHIKGPTVQDLGLSRIKRPEVQMPRSVIPEIRPHLLVATARSWAARSTA